MKTELGVEPETATQALEAQIRADEGEAPVPMSPARKGGGQQMLIAPFEDLGGGDTASFLAKEMPLEIVKRFRSRNFNSANLLVDAAPGADLSEMLNLARAAQGIWLVTGTTRQLGERIRIAITGVDIASGDITVTETEVIPEAESFEFLERVGAIVTNMFRLRYRKIERIDAKVLERLEELCGDPDRFYGVANDFFRKLSWPALRAKIWWRLNGPRILRFRFSQKCILSRHERLGALLGHGFFELKNTIRRDRGGDRIFRLRACA